MPELLLLWYVLASAASYVLYSIDKRAARLKRGRISERTLHCWAWAGGWPGAMLAQQRLRHKTVKPGFRIYYRLSVAGNLLVLGLCALMVWKM